MLKYIIFPILLWVVNTTCAPEFLELGVTDDVKQTFLSVGNESSDPIEVPHGFAFGNKTLSEIFVGTNGYLSFGTCCLPGLQKSQLPDYVVLPYLSNISIADPGGSISYEIYNLITNPAVLSRVSRLIRHQNNSSFSGTWMLVAEWKNVTERGHDTVNKNTFQGIVITNGFQSYTVFTYKCGELQLSSNAVIGFKADSVFNEYGSLSEGNDSNSIACINSPETPLVNIVYQLHLKHLPYLTLGISNGVNTTYLPPTDDGTSDTLSIPEGFPFGNTTLDSVYVSTNGLFSFNRPYAYHTPHLFPGGEQFLVTPYWSDIDISNGGGSVAYEIHNTSSDVMTWTSTFISQQQQTVFNASWMVVAEWRNVTEYQGPTDVTNTFQAVLATDGVKSYAVFTYNCDEMEWAGDATIGYNTNGGFWENHELNGAADVNAIACQSLPGSIWSNVVYRLGQDYLPMLSLETDGVSQVYLHPILDGASTAIDIPVGFPLGSTEQDTVYVVTNGLLSFGRSVTYFSSVLFPESREYINLVAPFWADHDIRLSGSISYEVHSQASGLMSQVSTFISLQEKITFQGTWMLVAEWNDVPEFGSTDMKSNSYQTVIITNGTDSYAVFIYKCGALTWHGNATVGFNAGGTLFRNHPLSGYSKIDGVSCLNFPTSVWSNLVYHLVPSYPSYLLYTNHYYISSVKTDGTEQRNVRYVSYRGSDALDFDIRRNLLFWSNDRYNQILRASLNGTESSTVLVYTGISCPYGLAWDWINEKLYWSDYCYDRIEVFDPKSSHRKVLFSSSLVNPRNIVVDPSTRTLYWAEQGYPAQIEKASMDGTAREVLHELGYSYLYALTVDFDTQTLYWMDYNYRRLEKSHTDGSDRVFLTSYGLIYYPSALTYYDGRLYWSDWNYNRLLTTSIDAPASMSLLSYTSSSPYGVQMISQERQRQGSCCNNI